MAERMKLYLHSSGAVVESFQDIMEVWHKINVHQDIVAYDDQRRCRPTGSKRKDLDDKAGENARDACWNVTSKGNFAFIVGWRMQYRKCADGAREEESVYERYLNYKHQGRLLGPLEILV